MPDTQRSRARPTSARTAAYATLTHALARGEASKSPRPTAPPAHRGFRCAELVQGEDNHLERPDEELAGQLGICGARTMAHRVRSAATRLAVASSGRGAARAGWVR